MRGRARDCLSWPSSWSVLRWDGGWRVAHSRGFRSGSGEGIARVWNVGVFCNPRRCLPTLQSALVPPLSGRFLELLSGVVRCARVTSA